jgi:hypothetical protein
MDQALGRSVVMRSVRRLGLFLLVSVLAAGLATTGLAWGASAQSELAANRAAAHSDVVQHLRGVRMPAGATSIRTEPQFAKAFGVISGPGGKYDASDQAMWTTEASPQSILAYVKAHKPAGAIADMGSGSGSDSKTGVTSIDIQFSWPDVSRKLLNRMLTVTVVPRSAAEMVPNGVHAVQITLRLGPTPTGPVVKPGGHVKTTTYLVWRAARVRALIDAFDRVPIVQPGAEPIACPLELTGSEASGLTLDFKSGRNGATLAHVEVSAQRGAHGYDGAGPCNPIDFWIGAKQQTSLMSPTFVRQVGKLIGANIS